jgi:hypothetical protein
MLQWLPRDAEQLAMESGGEGTANARSTRSSGRLVGWTCIPAPGETSRRAGSRLKLAAAVRELPYVAAKRRKVPASRPSDTDCCPFAAHGHVRDADGASEGAFCLVRTHETPGDPRVRALPSPVKPTFGWLALSCETFSTSCPAEAALDGTETGHIRDAERDGGGRGGHLPPADGHGLTTLRTVPGWSSFAGQERMSGIPRR